MILTWDLFERDESAREARVVFTKHGDNVPYESLERMTAKDLEGYEIRMLGSVVDTKRHWENGQSVFVWRGETSEFEMDESENLDSQALDYLARVYEFIETILKK